MHSSATGQLHINNNYILYILTGSLLFLTSGFFMLSLLSPFTLDNSYATSSDATVNVADSLSISATPVSITDTPESSGSWLTGTSNVVVSTNNATGYKLYISSSDSQVDLVNSNNSSYKIASLSTETPESTFKSDNSLMNHYGFTHDNNGDNTNLGQITSGTYLPITDVDNARLINATEEKQNLSTTNVTFATKIDRSIPAGEYTNTITFTAIANPVLYPIEDNMYMQDVTPEMCDSESTLDYDNDDKTYTLIDSRDDNEYQVRKLADGNCWMVDNLKLVGGSTGLTLSSADTDLNTIDSFNLPASSSTSSWSSSSPYNALADRFSSTYGGYYTWSTAVADTSSYDNTKTAPSGGAESSNSICPKNWKLPPNSGTGSFYTLYNSNTSNFRASFNISANSSLPGLWNYNGASSPTYSGSYGYWWSRTSHASDAYNTYILSVDSYGGVYPQGYNYRYYGSSVRCVLSSS